MLVIIEHTPEIIAPEVVLRGLQDLGVPCASSRHIIIQCMDLRCMSTTTMDVQQPSQQPSRSAKTQLHWVPPPPSTTHCWYTH